MADSSSQSSLTGRALVWIALGIAVLTGAMVTVLWWAGTRGLTGDQLVSARFDALKIGLSIGVGSGGVLALYLAWRRQRSTEDTLAHQQEVAADTNTDAIERRITELYTKAAEQLGSDKAPIRLAGLYALERLAQGTETQRQTIVNVLCAYLRMPTEPPDAEPRAAQLERAQEREVRLTAQRILAHHMRPGFGHPVDTFWPDVDLDLTGAVLIDADFSQCRLRTPRLAGATFVGDADFTGATFVGNVSFGGVTFAGKAGFEGATFARNAWFEGATFAGDSEFGGATFARHACFREVSFPGKAGFHGATFTKNAWFGKASFTGNADFRDAAMAKIAEFHGTTFTSDALFGQASFSGNADFRGATFARNAVFREATFSRSAAFSGAVFHQEAGFRGATFTMDAEFSGVTFTGDTRFVAATFTGDSEFRGAVFSSEAGFSGVTFTQAPQLGRVRFERQVPPEVAQWVSGNASVPDGQP